MNQRIQEIADQVRDLLSEAGTLAVLPYLSPEDKARLDLSIANPSGETYAREEQLTERLNSTTESAINAAIAAVWMATKENNQ